MSDLFLSFSLPGGRRLSFTYERQRSVQALTQGRTGTQPAKTIQPPRFDRLFGQSALFFAPPASGEMPLPRGKRIR